MKAFLSLVFVLFAIIGGKPTGKGYDRIDPFHNGMAKVHKDGYVGFINEKGEEFIACRYTWISDFANGEAKVEIDRKFGYINLQDEEIIPIKYEYIGKFNDGVAIVMIRNKFGLLSRDGKELTEIKYDFISAFNRQGFAKVRINRLEGEINRDGEEVVPVIKPKVEPDDE